MTYLNRFMIQKVEWLLEHNPAVLILGARQVGKTTLTQQVAPNWTIVELDQFDQRERLTADPDFFFKNHGSHVIFDEAQDCPELFNVLRKVIDQERSCMGRFILTGSSSPALMKRVSESLAGRIGVVELGTLKAAERFSKETSPLYQLFHQKLNAQYLPSGQPPLENHELSEHWLIGGYPQPALTQASTVRSQWYDDYMDTYIHRDLVKLAPKIRTHTFQRMLRMLVHLSGKNLNKSDLARAIEVNEKTVGEYLNILAGTFVWRSLTSFERQNLKSIIKMPKGYLRDSGLWHHLLKLQHADDLLHHPAVGLSFEGFVIEELLKGLFCQPLANWQAQFYRTRGGAEVDLVLSGPFGTLPIEIKHGSSIKQRQLISIKSFMSENECPLGLVINRSDQIEEIAPNLYQVPATWL